MSQAHSEASLSREVCFFFFFFFFVGVVLFYFLFFLYFFAGCFHFFFVFFGCGFISFLFFFFFVFFVCFLIFFFFLFFFFFFLLCFFVFRRDAPQYLLTPNGSTRAASLLRFEDRSVVGHLLHGRLQRYGSFTTSFSRTYGQHTDEYRARTHPRPSGARVPDVWASVGAPLVRQVRGQQLSRRQAPQQG